MPKTEYDKACEPEPAVTMRTLETFGEERGTPAYCLARKPFSSNPLDTYLEYALCRLGGPLHSGYAVWLVNRSGVEAGRFEGFYTEDILEAFANFDNRGIPTKLYVTARRSGKTFA